MSALAASLDPPPRPPPAGIRFTSSIATPNFRPVADQKALEFSVTVDEGLPATVVTDEQRLQQSLNWLLEFALRALGADRR